MIRASDHPIHNSAMAHVPVHIAGDPCRHRSLVATRLRGLTLLEVLVTCAVIALISLCLLPVVRMVRESARSLKCLSSLRQLGAAVNQYASDNDRKFPSARNWRSGTSGTIDEWNVYILDYIDNPIQGTTNGATTLSTGRGVDWNCSSTFSRGSGYGITLYPLAPDHILDKTNDIVWATLNGYPARYYRMSEVSSSSSRVLIGDSNGGRLHGTFWRDATGLYGYEDPRHRGRFNAVFFDLHTRHLSKQQGMDGIRDPGRYSE